MADGASSLTRELWQLIMLNKALLLTKTASCPNSCVANDVTQRPEFGSQELIYVKLKKWIKKTEGMLPHRLHCLLYHYMAALQIILLGISLKQKIDKRKKIPEQNLR